MQKDLQVKTQNKRGGAPQFKENLGYATVFLDDDNKIIVDNYEGFGETYKRAKETNVTIILNGNPVFNGSLDKLEEKLK